MISPEELVARLQGILGDLVKDIKIHKGNDYIEVEVDKDKVYEAASKLKEAGFDHVKDVTVVDYPKEKVFRIIYNLSSYRDRDLSYYVVGLAYNIPRDNPKTISLARLYVSAEFQEREAFEGFGVEFEGHPDLRPLLLVPPLAEQKPMRKDFIVKEEPEILAKPPKKG